MASNTYICTNCGREDITKPFICPDCGSPNSYEIKSKKVNKSNVTISSNIIPTLKRVNPNADPTKDNYYHYRITRFPKFNEIIAAGNGMCSGQVIILTAAPGSGKSTFAAELNPDYYITTEETYEQVNNRFNRVTKDSDTQICATTSYDEILGVFNLVKENELVIVDSLNMIDTCINSYAMQAKVASELTNLAKQKNCILIIICQVNRNGEITGMSSLMHVVDTICYMERGLNDSSKIILYTQKNRFNEVGPIDIFEHHNSGLEETELSDFILDIGCSNTMLQMGPKKMHVQVQALCADSSDMHSQIITTGLDKRRIQRLIGTICYVDSNIMLYNKNIYVSLSGGISSNSPTLDLAICDAILSSYYKKNGKEVEPLEVSMNGKANGKEVVKELIQEIKQQ